jgi:hypothetical protein
MKEETLSDNVVVKYLDDDFSLEKLSSTGVFVIQSTSSGKMLDQAILLSEMVTGTRAMDISKEIIREEGEIEIIYSKSGNKGPIVVLGTSLHKDGTLNIETFIDCMEKFLEYDFIEKEIFVCLYLQKIKGTTWGIVKQYLLSRFKNRKINIILFKGITEDHEKRTEQRFVEKGKIGERKDPIEE